MEIRKKNRNKAWTTRGGLTLCFCTKVGCRLVAKLVTSVDRDFIAEKNFTTWDKGERPYPWCSSNRHDQCHVTDLVTHQMKHGLTTWITYLILQLRSRSSWLSRRWTRKESWCIKITWVLKWLRVWIFTMETIEWCKEKKKITLHTLRRSPVFSPQAESKEERPPVA